MIVGKTGTTVRYAIVVEIVACLPAHRGYRGVEGFTGYDGGWPTDAKLEELRDAWFNAPDVAAQKKIAEDMQKRAFETVPYIPTAQFIIPTAYRSNLSGVIISPVTFIWNVEKK